MNAYHNLAGFLRDLRAILNDRASYQLADSYYWQLCDLLTEMMADVDIGDDDESDIGADEPDAEDLVAEDAPPHVDMRRSGDGSLPRTNRRGPESRGLRKVGGAARVEDVLPRPVQEARKGSKRKPAPVAGARKRVSRGTK